MMMKYLRSCCWVNTRLMSWEANLPKSRPWASLAGYVLDLCQNFTLAHFWNRILNVAWNSLCFADTIRQVSEAPKHPRKEHPGWIQTFHFDESCGSSLLFVIVFTTVKYFVVLRKKVLTFSYFLTLGPRC